MIGLSAMINTSKHKYTPQDVKSTISDMNTDKGSFTMMVGRMHSGYGGKGGSQSGS